MAKVKTKIKKSPAAEAPAIKAETPQGSRFECLVATFVTAFIIIITHMYVYERPMDQFYWFTGRNDASDFFSYYKMIFILISAVLMLLIILYRVTTQTFRIKMSVVYIFMLVYMAFVGLSHFFSDYKEFALLGYNDRFEGTLVLLAYMVFLYFTFNLISNERNLKWIVYGLGASSVILGMLGLSQYLDHDFFRTTIGKKLITPSDFWDQLDSLQFTFQNREIYQTVYNINYVSFYITLFIPLFALMFIRGKSVKEKVIWAFLFFLAMFNLIGSKSSGGLLGLAVAFVLALVIFNKRLLEWKKPLLVLIGVTVLVGGFTYQVWTSELQGAIGGVLGDRSTQTEEVNPEETAPEEVAPGSVKPHIDYIETHEDSIVMSLNGEPLIFSVIFNEEGEADYFRLYDKDENPIPVNLLDDQGSYYIMDERFQDYATLAYGMVDDFYHIFVMTPDMNWTFALINGEVFYINQLGKPMYLEKAESIGFENNLSFGSGRGYIWSRTLPMLKDTLVIGHGADTYCIYFPHYDYAGKYNAGWDNVNMVVDKPHNMYMGMIVGTGGISMLALLAIYGYYLVQSMKLYFRLRYESFSHFAGAGIFIGIAAFLVAGLVNDSSVSVMPMFYCLLGTGLGVNHYIMAEKTIATE